MLGQVRFTYNTRAARRPQREALRGLTQEPTLIVRGMIEKSRRLAEATTDPRRRADLDLTRSWALEELARRGVKLRVGHCAFCDGVLEHGRCTNRVCRDTLKA